MPPKFFLEGKPEDLYVKGENEGALFLKKTPLPNTPKNPSPPSPSPQRPPAPPGPPIPGPPAPAPPHHRRRRGALFPPPPHRPRPGPPPPGGFAAAPVAPPPTTRGPKTPPPAPGRGRARGGEGGRPGEEIWAPGRGGGGGRGAETGGAGGGRGRVMARQMRGRGEGGAGDGTTHPLKPGAGTPNAGGKQWTPGTTNGTRSILARGGGPGPHHPWEECREGGGGFSPGGGGGLISLIRKTNAPPKKARLKKGEAFVMQGCFCFRPHAPLCDALLFEGFLFWPPPWAGGCAFQDLPGHWF